MKCISIKQPWAWLIAAGYKDIENRSWGSAFRGECLIHASACMTRREYQECAELALKIDPDLVYTMPSRINFLRGGIIGKCEIVDVVTQSKSPWFSGPVGWCLRNASHFAHLHEMKGQLGFFDVDASQIYHTEKIICPFCKDICDAVVEHTIPFASYVHECVGCGSTITESEWQTVEQTKEIKT